MIRILILVILCLGSLQSCINQDTITYQAQLKSDTTSLGPFVRNNNPDAIKMPAGFWYSIDDLQDGIYPTLPDEITISYKVKLIPNPVPSDLKEADLETVGYSKSSTILLSSAISGLQQGLMLFPDSSSGRIYIPSGLAFGMGGHTKTATDTFDVSIPANANLLYEIKLISVKSTRFASDTAAIGGYLRNNSIVPVPLNDVSGVRYTIDYTGQTSTVKPQPGDYVLVTYTEDLLTTDSARVNTRVKFAWNDQITGWRIMLQKYSTQGSTITMYVPSGYAYGSFGKEGIQANSNMKYKVTLDSVIHH